MTNEKLKPCPFCGSDAVMSTTLFGQWTVCCTNYGCRCWDCGPNGYEAKDEAVYAWNRRHEQDLVKTQQKGKCNGIP
jgi:hypothetical protein